MCNPFTSRSGRNPEHLFAYRLSCHHGRWDSRSTYTPGGVLRKGVGEMQLNGQDLHTREPIPVGERVGSFRYLRAEDRWEWSDVVAQMHGYAPDAVQPTTALVLSHKHPEDAETVALLIEAMTREGKPFSSRHRIVDTLGKVHPVVVISERLRDDDGEVIGCRGLYVDRGSGFVYTIATIDQLIDQANSSTQA